MSIILATGEADRIQVSLSMLGRSCLKIKENRAGHGSSVVEPLPNISKTLGTIAETAEMKQAQKQKQKCILVDRTKLCAGIRHLKNSYISLYGSSSTDRQVGSG